MDLAGMKQGMRTGIFIKWTSTKQMPADGMTKDKLEAILFLRKVMRESRYSVTAIDGIEMKLTDEKAERKVEKIRHRKSKTTPEAYAVF